MFYQALPSFSEFTEVTRDRHFVRVPADWSVVVTDVRGSTRAIEEGRYKDVNQIGAAAIAAVQNRLGKGVEFPYVFGGDGATLLLPPEPLEAAVAELGRLKRLAEQRFGLALRVGFVRVGELEQEGAAVEVSKYALPSGNTVAMFRGGGLSLAEAKIKGQPERYEVPSLSDRDPDLSGLSCRWREVPSERGRVLSLLVLAMDVSESRAAETYELVLRQLNGHLEGGLSGANPIHPTRMTYARAADCYRNEVRYHRKWLAWQFLPRALHILGAILAFKVGIPPLYFRVGDYQRSLRTHSDYRKFDDTLRMVIDCSPEQCGAIRRDLEALRADGRVRFGMHEAVRSLITCWVHQPQEGQHLHFVDGCDGGYAMAAKELKAQLKEGDGR